MATLNFDEEALKTAGGSLYQLYLDLYNGNVAANSSVPKDSDFLVYNEDLSKYDKLPPSIKEAMGKKLTERRTKAAEEATDIIINLIDETEKGIRVLVEDIRRARKIEKSKKALIEEANRAREYGYETNNWLPLYAIIYNITSLDKKYKVPEDWKHTKLS